MNPLRFSLVSPARLMLAGLLVLTPARMRAQEPGASGPSVKALKYHEALVKRPVPGYLFDRFYNAWLDTGTIEELEKYLTARVAAEETTAGRLLLAFFHAKQGDNVKAIGQFRAALEKNPGSAEAWFQKAVVEARTLNFETALQDLEKAAGAKPEADLEGRIRQMQARLFVRSGQQEKAVELWKGLLSTRGGDEELREDLIDLQVAEGLLPEAEASAKELIALTKDAQKKILRQLRLGDIQQRAGRKSDAVETYAACLAGVGADSWLEKEILNQIDQVFRREDDMTGLRAEYEKLIAAAPARLAPRVAQARLLAATGEGDKAVKAWQDLLALTPGDRGIREGFIETLTALKKLPEAVEQLQQLISKNPGDLEQLLRLADLRFQQGDKVAVRVVLEDFLAKAGVSEGVTLRIAGLGERYGLPELALGLFEKAVTADPKSEALREAQAATLHKLGRKPEAVAAWKQLAAGADRARLLQVARLMTARDEQEAAYTLLREREEEFKNDPLYLAELCDVAVRLQKSAEAWPWARRRVGLTAAPADLELALDQAVKIAAQAADPAAPLREVEGSAGDPQDQCLLAALLEAAGRRKDAEAVLEKVAAVRPGLAAQLQVRLFVLRSDWMQAAAALRRQIELPEGKKASAVQRLVGFLQRAEQPGEALKWIAEWKRLSPGSVQPWLEEASLLGAQGKSGEALRALRMATQQFPDNDDLKAKLAGLFREEGKLADAQRLFDQLFEDGKDPGAKLRWVAELATTAEMQGKTGELVESFEERRRGNRASTLPLLALAEIHRTSDNYEKRRDALMEASRLKPDDVDLLLEVARVEQSQSEPDRAIETLKKAMAVEKGPRSGRQLARALFEAGRDDEGTKLVNDLAGGGKPDPREIESLADSLSTGGDWERVAAFLRPHAAAFPDDYRVQYFHALVLEEQGATREAFEVFRRLLAADQEMTGLPPAPPGRNQEWVRHMTELLPAGAVEFLTFDDQVIEVAYAHRDEGRRNGYGRPARNQAAARIPLPCTLADLKRYAVAHLVRMAPEMDDATRNALPGEFAARGMGWARYLGDGRPRDIWGNPEQVSEWLAKSPGDETLLALAGFVASFRDGVEPAHLLECFARFKEARPRLAATAGMALARAELTPESTAAVRETLEKLLPALPAPGDMLAVALLRALGMNEEFESIDPSSKLPPDLAGAALDQLVRGVLTATQTSPWDESVLRGMTMLLTQRKDWTRLIQILDHEVEMAASRPVPTGAGSRDEMVLELEWPPAELPSWPQEVTGLLGEDSELGGPDNQAALKTAAPSAKDPVLRLLLTRLSGDEAATAAGVAQLAASASLTVDQCVLLASWFAGKEQPLAAGDWLKKARYLPATREARTMIDCLMLGLASAAASTPENAPLIEAGREAALRLKQGVLSRDQRMALISALDTLGLGGEAEKLQTAATTGAGGGSGSRSSYQPAGQLGGRVSQLLAHDSKDEAVQLLVSEFRRMAGAALTSDVRNSASEQLVNITESQNLAPAVIKAMEPPADSDPLRLAQFALSCQSLGLRERAVESYEKALAAKPKEDLWRARLFTLLIEKQPDRAAALLAQSPPANPFIFWRTIIYALYRERGLPLRLALAESFLTSLPGFPPPKKGEAEPLTYFFALIGGNAEVEGETLNALDYRILPEDEVKVTPVVKESEKVKPWREKQRSAYERMCGALLQFPGTAIAAFAARAGLPRPAGAEDPVLAIQARELLLRKDLPLSGEGLFQRTRDGQSTAKPMPGRYLIEQAWRAKDRSSIDTDFIPALTEAKRPVEAAIMKTLADLYFCPEADFPGLLRAEMAAQAVSSRKAAAVPLDGILGVYRDRDLKSDLAPALAAAAAKPPQPAYAYFQTVASYARYLAVHGRGGELPALFSSMAGALLGPREGRAELVKKHLTGSRSFATGKTAGPDSFAALLQTCVEAPGALVAVMAAYEAELAPFAADPAQPAGKKVVLNLNNCPHHDPSFLEGLDKDALAFLDASPFLAGAGEFRAWFTDEEEGDTLCGHLMVHARDLGAADRDKLVQHLRSRPSAFGRDLFLCVLDKLPLHDFLVRAAAQKDALAALPPDRLREITVMFTEDIASVFDAAREKDLTPDDRAMLEFLNGQGGGGVEALAPFLAGKSLRELKLDASDADGDCRRMLLLARRSAVDRVPAVIAQTRVLLAEAARKNPYSNNGGIFNSAVSDVVEHLLPAEDAAIDWKKPDSLVPFSLYAAAMLVPEKPLIRLGGSARSRIGALWQRLWKEEMSKGPAPEEEKWRAFLARLGAALPGRQFDLLSGCLVEVINPKAGLPPALAAHGAPQWPVLDAMLRTRALQLQPKGAEQKAPDQQAVVALLTDATVPWAARLSVAAGHFGADARLASPEAVRAAAALLVEGIRAGGPLDEVEAQRVLHALLQLPDDEPGRTAISAVLNSARVQSAFDQEAELLNHVRELSFKIDDTAAINRLLSRQENGSVSSLALLVLHHKNEMGKKYVDANLSTMLTALSGSSSTAVRWTEAVATAQPAFLAAFDNEAVRYSIEVLLAGLSDPLPDSGLPAPKEKRSVRLEALARRFPTAAFTEPALMEKVLGVFAGDGDTGMPLDDAYKAYTIAQPLARVLTFANDEVRRAKLRIHRAYSYNAIRAGRAEALTECVDVYGTVLAGSTDSDLREDFANHLNKCMRALFWNHQKWDLPTQKRSAALWCQVIERPDLPRMMSTPSHAVKYVIWAHSFPGLDAEFATWWNGLAKDRKEYISGMKNFGSAKDWFNPAQVKTLFGDDSTRRLKVMRSLLSNPTGIPFRTFTGVADMLENKWFTHEEYLAMGPDIVPLVPAKGRTAFDLAQLFLAAGKLDDAMAFATRSVSDAAAAKNNAALTLRATGLLAHVTAKRPLGAPELESTAGFLEQLNTLLPALKPGDSEPTAIYFILEARARSLTAAGKTAEAAPFYGLAVFAAKHNASSNAPPVTKELETLAGKSTAPAELATALPEIWKILPADWKEAGR